MRWKPCFDVRRVVFGVMAVAMASGVVAQSETLVFAPNNTSNNILKFIGETGEYKGIIGAGFLTNPLGIEMDPVSGFLFVADQNSAGGAVLRFDPYTGAYAGLVGSGFLTRPDEIAFGPDGTMYVTDIRSSGQSVIMRFDPITGAYDGLFASGFLGSGLAGLSLYVDDQNIVYVQGADGTAIQRFNGETGAYLGAIGSGFFTQGRGVEMTTVGGQPWLLTGSFNQGSIYRWRLSDSSFRGLIASGGFAPTTRAIAMLPNGQVLVRSVSNTEYIARFVPETGEYKGLFMANFNTNGFGLAVETPARVTGVINLLSLDPGAYPRTVTLEVIDNSGNVVDTQTVSIDNTGAYVLRTYARGNNFRVSANGTRWLRRVSAPVNIDRDGVGGVNFSLPNGDVNADAIVDGNDVNVVLANFGAEAPFPNAAIEAADVNGDTIVDGNDVNIILANFGGEDE